MNPDDIGYAISKQLPCIELRAELHTDYGDLVLEGESAMRVASAVRRELELMLKKNPTDSLISYGPC